MRILLADGQAKVRFALRVLLERQPRLEVVGEATSAEELLAHLDGPNPDLILLDWSMAGLDRPGLLSSLRRQHPDLWIIVLSGRPEAREAALAAGADAFVSKGNPPEQLLAAIARCDRSSKAASLAGIMPQDVLAA